MKKSVLFGIFAIGIGLVSCDNDFDFPNPPGQSNPQEPIYDSANLTISSIVSGTINLDEANNSDTLVPLAEITASDSLVAGYELKFVGQMAATDAFSTPAEFPVELQETQLMANPDDLDAAFHEVMKTLDPASKETHIRYIAYAVEGSNYMRLGGENVYCCPMTATMSPFAPEFTIEEEYYIVGTCTNGTLDIDKAIKMTNSGISPYDDPSFSGMIEVSPDQAAGGYEWAIVPRSTITAGSGIAIAPDADLADEKSGYLKDYTSLGTYGMINEASKFLLTVNLKPEDGLYSYDIAYAFDNLWTPGPANNWSAGASQMLYTNNYKNYQGYVHIDGEFKFTSAPDWDHTNFGFAEAGKLSTDGGAGNLNVTQNNEPFGNSLYWCTADIVALTYTTTPIESIAIIGDATVGGWSEETKMTPSEDLLTWTLKTTLTNGEFKFRANNDWNIYLGGSLDNLTMDGANITAPVTGEVTITLDLSSLPYTATIK